MLWESQPFISIFCGQNKKYKKDNLSGISDSLFLVCQNQSVARSNMIAWVISYQFKNGIEKRLRRLANIIVHYCSEVINNTSETIYDNTALKYSTANPHAV